MYVGERAKLCAFSGQKGNHEMGDEAVAHPVSIRSVDKGKEVYCWGLLIPKLSSRGTWA